MLKGGEVKGQAIDIYYDGEILEVLEMPMIDTIHTSGAGCTYAACLTAELAKGVDIKAAIRTSKQFVHAAIQHSISFGQGIGSVRHGALRQKK